MEGGMGGGMGEVNKEGRGAEIYMYIEIVQGGGGRFKKVLIALISSLTLYIGNA